MARTNAQWAAVAVLGAALALAVGGCLGSNSDKAGGEQHQKPVVLTMANGNGLPLELEAFAASVARLSHNTVRIKFENNWRQGSPSYETEVIADVEAGKADLGWAGSRAFDSVGVPTFDALHAPLLIDSYALEQKVLESPLMGDDARRAQAARRDRHRHPPGPAAQATRRIAPRPTRGLPRQDARHLAVTGCKGHVAGARRERKGHPGRRQDRRSRRRRAAGQRDRGQSL